MASLLSRRFINPKYLSQNPNSLCAFLQSNIYSKSSSEFLTNPNRSFLITQFNPPPKPANSKPSFLIRSQSIGFYSNSVKKQILQRYNWNISHFLSSLPEKPESGDSEEPAKPLEFKHQEIEGPTVERDLSALANETRQALDSLRKSIYDLSSSLALLGIANLVLGASVVYLFQPHGIVAVQSLAAFAFPFSVAFLMRRSLKPMTFFRKMEERGRLQILTLTLQSFKGLNLLFLRTRVLSYGCAAGITVGSLITLWPQ